MRALAEQVLAALDVRDGDQACDLLCDGGTMTVAMVQRTQNLTVVDQQRTFTNAAAQDVSGSGHVEELLSDGRTIPLPAGSCDVVASLLTLGFGDAGSLVTDTTRVLRPGGRAALLVWDVDNPPAHVAALDDALRRAGHASPFLAACVPSLSPSSGWSTSSVNDVARFEGIGHGWTALVDDTHLRDELDALSPDALHEARAYFSNALAAYQAADGTMRIPVSALLIQS